ncbi:DUF1622 domain-containing protein [Jannaschia formosa]|uniref:DUF1622 domain-containing protein n=1 Tax=Jannaschia formosa TaxID=2259592 RepID=UPI000E1B691D|nr:DUF1622 domain-containing protein [Jannaschia formosa]TFL20246.1 DUF1622 domain-containing protein [Jannaschia formosa]
MEGTEQDDAEQLLGWLGYDREAGVLHGQLDWLVHLLDWAVVVIDLLAIAILLIGATRFVVGFLRAEIQREGVRRVKGINRERVELGRYILAGLEFLIVSDIIHTALSLKMIDLFFLGLLVVIRSLISYFLDKELEQVKKELGS